MTRGMCLPMAKRSHRSADARPIDALIQASWTINELNSSVSFPGM
jgi:hypothetical protein